MIETITKRQLEIIESAGKILTISGVGGLTTKKLAKEMNFSESALYRHFASKENIIIAMLAYLANTMDERYTRTLANESSPEEKFITLLQNLFAFFHKNPHFVVAVFSDGLMEENKRINATILKIMAVKIKHLKPIIEEGQLKNIFTKTISVDDLIHIVLGAIRLQMYKWRVANFQFDIIEEGDKIIHSILKLIKKQP